MYLDSDLTLPSLTSLLILSLFLATHTACPFPQAAFSAAEFHAEGVPVRSTHRHSYGVLVCLPVQIRRLHGIS